MNKELIKDGADTDVLKKRAEIFEKDQKEKFLQLSADEDRELDEYLASLKKLKQETQKASNDTTGALFALIREFMQDYKEGYLNEKVTELSEKISQRDKDFEEKMTAFREKIKESIKIFTDLREVDEESKKARASFDFDSESFSDEDKQENELLRLSLFKEDGNLPKQLELLRDSTTQLSTKVLSFYGLKEDEIELLKAPVEKLLLVDYSTKKDKDEDEEDSIIDVDIIDDIVDISDEEEVKSTNRNRNRYKG